ncbi:hypothetical protein HYR99_09005 [Candidatus Poribacteria bacterium]|nr:hypothetical protein [Candidatus Poribacteria bacterium]MBI3336865.1 hypothetical protein [Candidatus Peregrinibacteria bacterium]
MQFKQKMAYMALGGVLVILGFLLSKALEESFNRQQQKQKVDAEMKALTMTFDYNQLKIDLEGLGRTPEQIQEFTAKLKQGEQLLRQQGISEQVIEYALTRKSKIKPIGDLDPAMYDDLLKQTGVIGETASQPTKIHYAPGLEMTPTEVREALKARGYDDSRIEAFIQASKK